MFIMLACLFIYKKKKLIIYYVLILIYFVLHIIVLYVYQEPFNFLGELQYTLRTFYFPLIFVSLFTIKNELRINTKIIVNTLILYIILIFIPTIFHIGFKTYNISKEGTLGFFNSANEISAILSLGTPLLIFYLMESKNNIKKVLLFLIYIYVILSIGTKTPLLSLFISIILIFLWSIYKLLSTKKYNKAFLLSLGLAISVSVLIIFIPKTNFYKNIKIHLDYLGIEDATEIMDRYELIDHFIFSQRLSFLDNKSQIYKNKSLCEKLIGIGNYNDGKEIKAIEMDYFDIYYSNGIIGFILFFSPILLIFVKCFSLLREKTFQNYVKNICILLIVVLAFFTGHVLVAPSVAVFITAILLLNSKKNVILSSYNLDYGGIETSLINLLKNFNYKKYNVTLVLEEKKGIFLESVPKEVKILEYRPSNCKNYLKRKIFNVLKRIKWIICNYKMYDIAICYATYSKPCSFITRTSSDKKILFVHNDYYESYLHDIEKIKQFFCGIRIKSYNRIVFVSNESRLKINSLFKSISKKTKTINNLIDQEKIKYLSKEKILIDKNDKKTFIYIGRLDEKQKKVSRIIETARKLKNNKNVLFWILGDGPSKSEYSLLIKKYKLNNIVLLGAHKNPYPYLKKADYLILTSDYEGFPVVYNEAIILHKPILTTIEVSDDYISIPNRFGKIMDKDIEKIADTIKNEINSPFKITEFVDFDYLNKLRIKELEKIMEE